jgi:hypothetical protein
MSITHSTEIINGEAITILIETTDSLESNAQTSERTHSTTRGVVSDTLRNAQGVFSSGVELVRNCAIQVVTGIQSLDDSLKPEALEVQLAIKLGSAAGAVLAKKW